VRTLGGANAHIDIHANAFGCTWNDVGGIETYVYKIKPKEAVALAKKGASKPHKGNRLKR
jgi:N-acetylmuramoyl-L-alanine amidase